MTHTALASELHSLEHDAQVVLFTLDLAFVGGGVERWTTTETSTPLIWQSHSFPYIPMQVSGFELNGQGQLPRPRIEISVVDNSTSALVREYGDLVGCVLTRVRTFAKFLDNGSSPDDTAILPPDIYRIEQKTSHNDETIAWELSAYLDVAATKIPKRQVLRDTCLHTVRTWNADTETFDYSNASCPYVDETAPFYKRDGTTTTNPAEEGFGRGVSNCCKPRFGENAVLPTRAFPGVSRVR